MKIAIAQLNYTIGDIDGNVSKIIDAINKAKARRADLVIFAEQAVSGTPAFDLLRKTTFLELCEDALVEIASPAATASRRSSGSRCSRTTERSAPRRSFRTARCSATWARSTLRRVAKWGF